MSESCVFVQARMSSHRLPGKSLMQISGYPLVVLAALRAKNTGLRVVVVTSCEPSDDILFESVISYGIECFRGNLKNVLLRFKEASDSLKLHKDSLIIRLTGDNTVPDGALIDELISQYSSHSEVNYLGAHYPQDNLPYGLNIEVFKVHYLDDALMNASTDYDLEHVTPWIKRHSNCIGMTPKIPEKYNNYISSKLNLTIDSNDELKVMRSIFNQIRRPVDEPWYKICRIACQIKP